jgi:hypothetical protein
MFLGCATKQLRKEARLRRWGFFRRDFIFYLCFSFFCFHNFLFYNRCRLLFFLILWFIILCLIFFFLFDFCIAWLYFLFRFFLSFTLCTTLILLRTGANEQLFSYFNPGRNSCLPLFKNVPE